jgi:hypothetical protein
MPVLYYYISLFIVFMTRIVCHDSLRLRRYQGIVAGNNRLLYLLFVSSFWLMGVDLWRFKKIDIIYKNVRVCFRWDICIACNRAAEVIRFLLRVLGMAAGLQEFDSHSCSEKLKGRHAFHVVTKAAAVVLALSYLSLYRCIVTHRNVLSQGWEGAIFCGHICQSTLICMSIIKLLRDGHGGPSNTDLKIQRRFLHQRFFHLLMALAVYENTFPVDTWSPQNTA